MEQFPWKSESGQNIRGRRAFFFFEQLTKEIELLENALHRNLNFQTSGRTLSRKSLDSYLNEVLELEQDVGCVLTCLFGEVSEKEESKEVCVLVDNDEVAITDILLGFIGPKNHKWIGRPKILFLVHQPKTLSHENIPLFNPLMSISATNHSGWLVLVLKSNENVQNLIKIFQGNELKQGKSLQELLSTLLVLKPDDKPCEDFLNSTLQYLLNFPEQPRSFVKPDFSRLNSGAPAPVQNLSFDELLEEARKFFQESRVLLVSSVAGAGKTTVLREVAYQLGRNDSNLKILHVSLPEHAVCFVGRKLNEVNFLAKSTHFSSEEVKSWIDGKQALVLLDGFDEICPNHREKVLNFVETLNKKGVPILIGTRPHEADAILAKINKAALAKIDPFNKEKQIELLQMISEKTKQECEQFLDMFPNKDILENPLHLSMLAECDGEGNLYQVYDKVVRKKLELCLVRKGYDRNNANVFSEQTELALKSIRLIASRFLRNISLVGPGVTEKDLERMNDFGVAIVEEGNVTFLHHTFAEFLTTQQFISDVEETGESEIQMFEVDQDSKFKECRRTLNYFYETLTDEEDRGLHLEYFNLRLEFPLPFFKRVFSENLKHVFDLLKPKISFNNSKDINLKYFRRELLIDSIQSEEIAVELLEMGVIDHEQQLIEILPPLLSQAAIHNATDLFNKLKEKFSSLPDLIRSRSHEIDAGFFAVAKGHSKMLDLLLENGIDKDYLVQQRNVLFEACAKGSVECVKVLFKHGAREARDFYENHIALNVAAKFGNLELVTFLHEETSKEGDQDSLGWNALHHAVYHGHEKVAQYLLSHYPDFKDRSTTDGEDVLNLAVRSGRLEMCRFLLENTGFNLNSLTSCKGGSWSRNQLDFFLMLQGDARKRDSTGKTSLHCAAEYGHLDLVRELVESGAEIGATDENGWNAVHFSCYCTAEISVFDIIKYLHGQNSSLAKARTNDGRTALHILMGMCQGDKIDKVQFLVEVGVDVKALDERGETALRIAIDRNLTSCVRYLMTKDIDLSITVRGLSCLHYAAQEDDLDALRKWVEAGGDLNVKDESDDSTALHWASKLGHLRFVQELLAHGADLEAVKDNGETALMLACSSFHSNVETIDFLLTKNADANVKDIKGMTALIHTSREGNLEALQKLLQHGADLTLKDVEGKNAFHHAIRHFELVSFLLDQNGDLATEQTNDGSTALHLALKTGDERVLQWIVTKNIDIDASNDEGETVLILACQRKKWTSVDMLLAKNPDVNRRDKRGRTPLFYAGNAGNREVVLKLLDHGANPALTDDEGRNVLHHASMGLVLILHERNQDLIHKMDSSGNTPLHNLAYSRIDDFSTLESLTADFNGCNRDGKTALMLACMKGNVEYVRFLLSKGVDVNKKDLKKKRTALHHAVVTGDKKTVQLLIENGADTTAIDDEGQNLLHLAIPNFELVSLLLEQNKDLAKGKTASGCTALHLALKVRRDNYDDRVVSLLLDETAVDLDAGDDNGKTALILACEKRNWSIADVLLAKKVDVNKQDSQGTSALHECVIAENYGALQQLLEHGGDLTLKDNEGKNLLHYAVIHSDLKMISFLHRLDSNLVNEVTADNSTALHFVLDKDDECLIDEDTVSWLLTRTKVNASRIDGKTALMLICPRSLDLDVVDLLLTAEADCNKQDLKGRTALHHAVAGYENMKMVQRLLEHGADLTLLDDEGKNALHHALGRDFKMVLFLHDINRNLAKQITKNGSTSLHLASVEYAADRDLLPWLLDEIDADLIHVKDFDGKTALIVACENRCWKNVNFLLTRNVDVTARDNNGRSALDIVENTTIDGFTKEEGLKARQLLRKLQTAINSQ
ncbi:uncharacterized protein LOC135943106 [Cloeon dipterum]|uniref:uncharacterized protein LOC135943106 n=1 Tax=Cloeon dipterum TaxID=197152 RepID=UPI0032202183